MSSEDKKSVCERMVAIKELCDELDRKLAALELIDADEKPELFTEYQTRAAEIYEIIEKELSWAFMDLKKIQEHLDVKRQNYNFKSKAINDLAKDISNILKKRK